MNPDDLKKLGAAINVDVANALGDELLLNKAQASIFLNVSPRTIDAWCANIRERRRRSGNARPDRVAFRPSRDRLPYIKLGHLVFFMLGDLRRFRDARRVID